MSLQFLNIEEMYVRSLNMKVDKRNNILVKVRAAIQKLAAGMSMDSKFQKSMIKKN